jgi:hypothetical protein
VCATEAVQLPWVTSATEETRPARAVRSEGLPGFCGMDGQDGWNRLDGLCGPLGLPGQCGVQGPRHGWGLGGQYGRHGWRGLCGMLVVQGLPGPYGWQTCGGCGASEGCWRHGARSGSELLRRGGRRAGRLAVGRLVWAEDRCCCHAQVQGL